MKPKYKEYSRSLYFRFNRTLQILCTWIIPCFFCFPLSSQILSSADNPVKTDADIKTGAERTDQYLPMLRGKSVALVVNHTSLIHKTHLLDSLLSLKIKVNKIFAPEHGFRGMADAGEYVTKEKDKKSGLPIISLYGKNNKPTPENLKDVDILVFDIQDVGVRFYTYISTLQLVMESCAENKKPLLVLDRPNPNGYYVDGPVLEEKYKSFVGMNPVPVVYGLTIGEYATMVNGEGWLKEGLKCDLKVITLEGYTHNDLYELPVPPSPNLPNMASVYMYPSLALFEGTMVSVGRGTDKPFQVIGHPTMLGSAKYTFTPKSKPGAKNPMYRDTLCRGHDLSHFGEMFVKNTRKIYLYWLKGSYWDTPNKEKFFNNYFNQLTGNALLKEQVIAGKMDDTIRASWEPALTMYKSKRKKYLLYTDFTEGTK